MGSRSSGELIHHPLTYVRLEHNWTLQALADQLASKPGRATNRQQAFRWENHGVEPGIATQEALADLLKVPRYTLFSHRWPGWLPAGDRVPRDALWTPEGCTRVLVRTVEADPMDRRGFLTLAAGSTSELAVQWAEAPALAHEAVAQDVSQMVTDLENRLPILRSLEDRNGGEASRHLLDAALREAVNQFRSDGLHLADRPRLAGAISELARISGWAHVDAGRHAAAEHRFFAGLRAAHIAGDRLAGANLLKCVSLLLLEHGRAREALDVMETAVRQSRNGPDRVRLMLTVRQARVLAALGEGRECEQLLGRAEKLMDRAEEQDDAPGWAAYFDRAEFGSQVASCYLALERPGECDRWLERGLSLQPEDRRRDGITYQMWRAEAAVRMGEVDRGCSLVEQALPAMAGIPSVRNQDRLKRVQTLLKPFRTQRAVAELMSRL